MKEKNLKIPVVITAYNRVHSLQRILSSVAKAIYDSPVELIISIDKSDNHEVKRIAEEFNWPYGEKRIIAHKMSLGLREHIISCGDLVKSYDGIILLEDDLYVSPYFYEYIQDAAKFYRNDKTIAGISLYSHNFNETPYLPFTPLPDSFDVFFMQLPSSWGQCWTKNQWNFFRSWYIKNQHKEYRNKNWIIPEDIARWPESSWKKYFFFYMIDQNKFFVYPRTSLSSNFSDPGTHIITRKHIFQRPLQFHKKQYKFVLLEDSDVVYDAFCEFLPGRLNRLCKWLKDYDYEMDIYGVKPLEKITRPYLISSRPVNNPLMSFDLSMKPAEMNIIESIEGNCIHLAEKENFKEKETRYDTKQLLYYYNLFDYHFPALWEKKNLRKVLYGLKTKDLIKTMIEIMFSRFKNYFSK